MPRFWFFNCGKMAFNVGILSFFVGGSLIPWLRGRSKEKWKREHLSRSGIKIFYRIKDGNLKTEKGEREEERKDRGEKGKNNKRFPSLGQMERQGSEKWLHKGEDRDEPQRERSEKFSERKINRDRGYFQLYPFFFLFLLKENRMINFFL